MKIRPCWLLVSASAILTICLLLSYCDLLLNGNFQILNFTAIQKQFDLALSNDSRISKTKSNHSFLYLTQTESCLSDYLLGPGLFDNGSKRDIVVLSWKQPCSSSSSSNLQHIIYIYKEKTTWGNGRNILYEFAKKLPNDYLYYIFMDDDLQFSFTNAFFEERYRNLSTNWPLQAFEYFLLKHEPAIGLPFFCLADWCEPVASYVKPLSEYFPATIWFDAALNAFHKDAVHFLLPYRLKYEQHGWWHSQKYLILAADLHFRGQILKCLAVKMVNNVHRNYPRNNWDNWAVIYDVLKAEIPERYRNLVNWKPRENIIDFKPVVKNNTVITPMYQFKMPFGKIQVEPFKHFKLELSNKSLVT